MQQLPMPWVQPFLEEAQPPGGGSAADIEHWPEYAQEFTALVPQHSLAQWMARYLKEEVAGVQAQNTLEAKTRDLGSFAAWMAEAHGTADIRGVAP